MAQHAEAPIDYSFRPLSYWHVSSLRQLLANIKGAERKKHALALMSRGCLAEVSDLVLTDCFSDEERCRLSKVDPALMGGEFLPTYLPNEVEIARVTMASVTQDVISIRARPKGERILYRVVDEYKAQFIIAPSSSVRPLTLQQLISLMDTGSDSEGHPIGLGIIQCLFDCTEEPAVAFDNFLTFSSEFYADLNKHYSLAIQQWVTETATRRIS